MNLQRVGANKAFLLILVYIIEIKARLETTTPKFYSEINKLLEIIAYNERYANIGCNSRSSGIHEIQISTIDRFSAVCNNEISNGGWIVFHRRFNGVENFRRSWSDYRDGFGNLNGDFFIGLELLYRITNSERYELYIEFEYFDGIVEIARYNNFKIGNQDTQYVLASLGDFKGTAIDEMTTWNLNQKFSTHDHDNDQEENTNCAWKYYGAWWYKYCSGPNINGKFNTNANGSWSNMSWNGFTAIKRVQMLIRPNLDD